MNIHLYCCSVYPSYVLCPKFHTGYAKIIILCYTSLVNMYKLHVFLNHNSCIDHAVW